MSVKYPKGSSWLKWDFHAHSPASHGFRGSIDQFIQQLKDADCSVIGINDYFSVETYKTLKEKINTGELEIDKTLLPVVEFRMRDVLRNRHTTSSGTDINFHVVFSDAISPIKIETFLKTLEVDGTQIADKYDNKQYLAETARVYFEKDVLEVLSKNPDFADKFIVILPYDEYGGIDDINPISDDWIKKGFIRKSHMLGSSYSSQIKFFLWDSPLKKDKTPKFTQEQFEEWFIKKKPCIKGSDSHQHSYPLGKLRDGNSNPIEKYCWIKAEPTFEGLRQVIFEPEGRIFIGESPPVKPTNVIDDITIGLPTDSKITVKQSDGTFKTEKFCFAGVKKTLELSPYFNCFVGGRGTGKSTILNFLGQHSKEPNSSKDFWRKLSPSFEPISRDNFTFSGISHFEFIGQSEVESFAMNKQAFTDAIYKRADILSDGKLGQSETEINLETDKIFDFRGLVEDVSRIEQDIEETKNKKKTLNSSIEVTKSEKYTKIVDQITEKSNQHQDLASWRERIDELRELIESLQDTTLSDDDLPDEEAPSTPNPISEPYQKAYEVAQLNVKAAATALEAKNFTTLEKLEAGLAKDIEKLEADLSTILEEAGLSAENVLQVKGAPQQLVQLDDKLEKLQKRLKEKNKELDKYDSVVDVAAKLKKKYEQQINEAVSPLVTALEEQSKQNEGKDIKAIGLNYYFDTIVAWAGIAEDFFAYFSSQLSEGVRSDLLKDYIVTHSKMFAGTHEEIQTLLKKEKVPEAAYIKFLKEIFLDPYNYKIFKAIRDEKLNDVPKYRRIQVFYDGKDIEQASFGQKCTAVVVILVLFGNYPLIIDEPEAHLDASLIANYLVPLIKKNKNNRQIIFATHNANFVVNGDAEKIIILKDKNGKTEFVETTIEDESHRLELMKLEGGKEAFKNRQDKLQIF
jgi:ABC-type lipoprotein export system ATPase subunit